MNRQPPRPERDFNDVAFAREYARRHQAMAERFGRDVAHKLSARGFRKGRIIDVGCGSGATALVLAEAFPESQVVGLDLSEPLLDIASRAAGAAALGERVRFERADACELPYEADFFDVALNINMLHLVDEPVEMLNEIERALVPGGWLFMADLRRSWLGLFEAEIKSAFTLAEARQVLAGSRLRPGQLSSGLLWWRFET